MKVRKINSISNLGQYINFEWPHGLSEFEKYNFFYGWNYSGKTSLSRIFRCLEVKEKHHDYQNMGFSLLNEDGKTITDKDIAKDFLIRVFNEDFIEDSFEWDNENAEIEPVLILGKESKELEKELKEKQSEKSKAEDEKRKKEQEKTAKEREIDEKLTDKASEIRRNLSITNPREFDKTKLEQKIQDIKDDFENKILNENEEENLRSILSSKKLEKISILSINFKLSQLIEDFKAILERRVTAQKIIEKFNQSPKLSEWVKEGIELHKEEETCQFCDNPLTKERLEELNQHFSEEFNKLMIDIKIRENEINDHKNELEKFHLPDKARFFDEF